jgi:hypothetical protein
MGAAAGARPSMTWRRNRATAIIASRMNVVGSPFERDVFLSYAHADVDAEFRLLP